MKDFLAPRLSKIARDLMNAQVAFTAREEDDPAEAAEIADARERLKPWIAELYREARFLGLQSTMRQAERIASFSDKWKAVEIDAAIEELERRFDEETESLVLLYISPEQRAYYQNTSLLGDSFKENFPTANNEVIEAGNCLALGRHSASVFHLMRALEVVLKAIFQALKLPASPKTGDRNWNGILRPIREKLDSDKAIADFDFYDAAYAFLLAAKNPLRNATMHVDAVYDEDSARIVFDSIGAFMRHAATELKESL